MDEDTVSTSAAAVGTVTGTGSGHTRPTAGSTSTEIELLEFELLRSAFYHDACERMLMGWHKWMTFGTLVLGSSAAISFTASYPLAGQIAGLLVAVFGAMQLVFDHAGIARTHGDLRRQFYDLMADLEAGAEQAAIRSKMTKSYADEPPTRKRQLDLAHDRAGTSLFGDDFFRADGTRPKS